MRFCPICNGHELTFDAEDSPLRPLQMDAPDIEQWLLARDPVGIGSYKDFGPNEYARAFTAAQTAGTGVIDDLYFAFVDAVGKNGGGEVKFAENVIPILTQKGWLGGDAEKIAARVQLIYDTNLRIARSAGQFERFKRTRAAFPYLRGVTVGDDRVRHPPKSPHSDHRAFAGIILPVDHSFWRTYYPPLGFRCRCSVTPMSRADLARYRGGVTSEAELQRRIAEIGPPVFASPAAPIGAQLGQMVKPTNASLMPGMPAVDPAATEAKGNAAWNDDMREAMRRQVRAQLSAMLGKPIAA